MSVASYVAKSLCYKCRKKIEYVIPIPEKNETFILKTGS